MYGAPERIDTPLVAAKEHEDTDALEHLLPNVWRGDAQSDDAKELGEVIQRQHYEALADRTDWEQRLSEWEDSYYNRVTQKDYPWPGAANFHVPLTMLGVETYKPRLIESVLGEDPPIHVVPIEASDETRTERVGLFLNWQVRNEMSIASTVAESAHLFLQPGTVVAKVYWDVVRKRRKYVREFPAATPLEEALEALFGDHVPTDLTKAGNMRWTGTVPVPPRSGTPLEVDITLRFHADDEMYQVKVVEEALEARPRVDLIEPPDFVAPAKFGSDIQDAPWVQHRMWVTEQWLRDKVLEGRFDRDSVQHLVDAVAKPPGDTTQADSSSYRRGQDAAEGVEGQGPSNARREQYEVLEDYRLWDIDDDGHMEHVITWYALDGRLVLGWDLLENIYAHGRRPFAVGRFFPVPFRFYGLALAEVIKGIQDEINTMHNQRVDYGTITNLPFYFYDPINMQQPFPARLTPGEGVPVGNPAASIMFPKWQGSTSWGQQEEAILHQAYERLLGLTDLSLGRQPTRVGATRTAAGTATLLSEAGLRQKTAIEAFQRFWIDVFQLVLQLDQEYLPPGKEFRVTGRMPEMVHLKTRGDIRGRYDLRLAMTTQTMNRVVAREDATTLMQTLLNPALIQAGMIGLKGVHRAVSKFLRAYGEDPDMWLEAHVVPHTPEQELGMLVSGDQIKPHPNENHAEHLQVHQIQVQDPLVRSTLGSDGMQQLMRHIQETVQVQQAMQMAASLQQQGGRGQQPARGPQQARQAQAGQNAPQPNAQTNLPPIGQGGATPGGGY